MKRKNASRWNSARIAPTLTVNMLLASLVLGLLLVSGAKAATLPSINISDASVTEGNTGGTSSLVFTVSLSQSSLSDVSVVYATANGTASDTDYTSTSGTLTIPVGQTTATITVPVVGDLFAESAETVLLNLSFPTNATLADGQGSGTIYNDDAPPSITIGDNSVSEGDNVTTTLSFTVLLSQASALPISVAYTTANNTATAGSDYVAQSGTLNIAAGLRTGKINITVNNDAVLEGNETFYILLTNPVNATISDNKAVGTIINFNSGPSLSINNVRVSEGTNVTTPLTYTVSLSQASAVAVSVNYSTLASSATAGTDYTSTSGTLTIPAGQTTATITVPVVGDLTVESDETFYVVLSTPVNANIKQKYGLGTIVNDDYDVNLNVSDASVTEGNSGTSSLVFTVSLSQSSLSDVSVVYATANGTASDTDYTSTSGTLTIPAGQTTATITVPVVGDTTPESAETVLLNLSFPTNANIGDGQGIGRILNDDAAPTITISNPSISEGNSGTKSLFFTLSLSQASGQTVRVSYKTADGTATAGSDYTAQSNSVAFSAGQISKTIGVPIIGDTTVEFSETLYVLLSDSTNATLNTTSGTGIIINDDTPAITVNDVSMSEGNAGTKIMTFIVMLSQASVRDVSVNYATANGTATALLSSTSGSDYTAKSGTLTIPAGQTATTVTISINGDTVVEKDETFYLQLSNNYNATLSRSSAAGTITNDDVSG